jgi:replicative DNA helicase
MLLQMVEDSEPIGLLEVATKLRSTPNACGGLAYISQLADGIVSSEIGHWVQVVKDLARRRVLWDRFAKAQDLLASGAPLPDVWEAVEDDAEVDEVEDAPERCDAIVADSYNRLMRRIDARRRGVTVSVPMPIPAMQERIDLPLGEGKAVLLGARPGMGKTAMALQAASCVAGAEVFDGEVSRRGRAMFFSMEMGYDPLVLRMACQHARLNAASISKGFGTDEEMARLQEGYQYVHELNLWVDKKPKHSPGSIRRRIERNIRKYGKLDVVVVDYIGLMDVIPREGERHDQAVSRAYRSLRECARRNGFTLWMLTQLNRKCEERANKRPTPADAKDSGGLEEHSDVVVLLYRGSVYLGEHATEDERTQAEIIIPKSRGGDPGTIRCRFNGPATLFHEGNPWEGR